MSSQVGVARPFGKSRVAGRRVYMPGLPSASEVMALPFKQLLNRYENLAYFNAKPGPYDDAIHDIFKAELVRRGAEL